MSERTVFYNGHWVSEQEARISIYDSALVSGNMVFDVTRTYHHHPFRLREYLERFLRSMEALSIDCKMDLDRLVEVTNETLQRNLKTESEEIDWNIIHNGNICCLIVRGNQDRIRNNIDLGIRRKGLE